MRARPSIIAAGAVLALAAPVRAQTPEPAPPPPTPDESRPTTPPPQAPESNRAPPQPQPPPATEPEAPQGLGSTDPYTVQRERAPAPNPRERFEIYGSIVTDVGIDFGQIGNPDWQDVLRPTKLPAFSDQFGEEPRSFLSVRQTRFGVKSLLPTKVGDIDTTFEFELFGVGVDTGQTTFRLRHAYGDWRFLRAGQTWSPFMDIDVFPNSLEYWGPPGMVFFRNVQLAWLAIRGDSRVTVAIERPGATADISNYRDRIELEDIIPRFPAPDVSAEGRLAFPWGYVEAAGIFRFINWDDTNPAPPDLSGHAFGWGVNFSSNVKLGSALLKLQAAYGWGIENYMNDASDDIGPEATGNVLRPLEGEPLGVLGLVAFVDLEWSKRFTSSAGWSMVWIDNSSGQAPDAFHLGHYALANLLWHPTEKLVIGGEFQYGRRENNRDDFAVNDFKLQFSFRFMFSKLFGGEP